MKAIIITDKDKKIIYEKIYPGANIDLKLKLMSYVLSNEHYDAEAPLRCEDE